MEGVFGEDDYEVLDKKSVYQGFFRLDKYRLKHRLFAGGWSEEYEREVFERGNSAAVILYDPKKDKLLFIEQFRIAAGIGGANPWTFEIVAGMVDKGRSASEVVYAEAIEEAGVKIDELIEIGSYLASPGGTSERVSLFCGIIDSTGVGGIHGLDDEHEDIKVHLVSLEQAKSWLNENKFDNAATIIALQWLLLNYKA